MFSAKITNSFIIERVDVKVFPEPVGADINIFWLLWIGKTPYFWGSENTLNLSLNQASTLGESVLNTSWSVFGFKTLYIILDLKREKLLKVCSYLKNMVRIAIIDKDKCSPEQCNWLCFIVCPVNRTGKECIKKGKQAIIDEDLCTGCSICPKKCPFKAIKIVNLPEQLKELPIHRYGENSFGLFHLPIPKKGKVVGILGRNRGTGPHGLL